jgi:hypothetical protein
VFKIYNGYWFFGRPTIEELRQDLRAVLRKCRPDWDITTPELKADWERGEHARFLSLWQDLRAGISGARVTGPHPACVRSTGGHISAYHSSSVVIADTIRSNN